MGYKRRRKAWLMLNIADATLVVALVTTADRFEQIVLEATRFGQKDV